MPDRIYTKGSTLKSILFSTGSQYNDFSTGVMRSIFFVHLCYHFYGMQVSGIYIVTPMAWLLDNPIEKWLESWVADMTQLIVSPIC